MDICRLTWSYANSELTSMHQIVYFLFKFNAFKVNFVKGFVNSISSGFDKIPQSNLMGEST